MPPLAWTGIRRRQARSDDLVPHLDVHAIEDAVISTYGGYAPLAHADFASLQG